MKQYKNDNIANYVYYGKTRLLAMLSGLSYLCFSLSFIFLNLAFNT